jgi:DNA-binding LacI/PurR family transcriptional regulator
MAATMKDVAEAAGVSIATVSFVLNNTKPVTPATRQKIEQAMAELGFRRNMVARALASRRTRIIALVCPFTVERTAASLKDFFIGAAQAANEADHHLVIWPVSNDGDALASLVGQKLVDGVVLMEVQLDDARVAVLRELDTPFALIGRTRDMTGVPYVDIDFDTSMEMCLDHLSGLGHRRIGFINGSQDEPGMQGFGPYVRTESAYIKLAGQRRMKPVIFRSPATVRAGRQVAREVREVDPGLTALIVLEEATATGVVAELAHQGRRVPGDLSVMSVLGSVEVAAMSDPPLTTVAGPGAELGRLGVKALLKQLDDPGEPTALLRAGELVIGESTGPVRGR